MKAQSDRVRVPFAGARSIFILVAVLAANIVALGPVRAADVTSTWIGATSGNWGVDGNWIDVPATGGFPNDGDLGVATYDAVINAVGSTYTITLGLGITVETLTLNSANATIDQTGGTFTATDAINLMAGTYEVDGGTISNTTINVTGGSLVIGVNGNNLLSGVTINGDLNLTAVSARTRIDGGTSFSTAHLANNGSSLGFAPDQTLGGTILFEGAVAGTRAVEMNGLNGSFTIGAAGVIRTAAGLGGDGQIGGAFQYGGNMTLLNQGLISSQTSGRTVTINPASFTNQGTVEAVNGGVLTISSNNWTNAGTISATGSSTVNFGGNFSALDQGTYSIGAGSTINLTGKWDNGGQNFTFNSGTGSWNLNGGTISGGSLSYADGQSLLIGVNGNNLLSGVTINGDLNLTAVSARTRIDGGTSFSTAHLANNGSSLGFAPDQTLGGTILFEGAAAGTRAVEMNGLNGSFTIGAAGVIRTAAGLGGDGQIGGAFQYGGNMTLLNQGLISSQTSGRTVTINPASFTNQGTVEAVNGGVLTISSNNWTNAGTISATGSSTVNFGGNFSALDQGTYSIGAGSTINLTGKWDNGGQNFTFNSGTGSWNLNGGTISGGSLSYADGQSLLIGVNGNNLLSGVTINGDLNLTAVSARTRIDGGTSFSTAHLANNGSSLGFAPDQTLGGTILFEGAAAGTRAVEMNGLNGSFTIGAAGVIRTAAGLGGDGQIGGAFQYGGNMTLLNQGLISSQTSGRTVTINPASFTNQGTIEALNGGVLTISSNNWTNAGTISATGSSTVNFGGNFSALDQGTYSIGAGSTINLTGKWDNGGQNFTFNSGTGSWNLNGGTISGGSLSYADGQSLLIGVNGNNLLSGVTINGDLNLTAVSARTRIDGGTSFSTAHLANNGSSLGFAPDQTLGGTILFEGAAAGTRAVEMNGLNGSFTIGAAGVIRTAAGLGGDGQIGGAFQYGGNMTLLNQGLISSQTSGRTVTINPASFTNQGTVEAINGGIVRIATTYVQTAGVTRVVNGTINVIGGALVQVNGGTLEGYGTIGGNVSVGGVLDPTVGSASGLAIAGDLSLGTNAEFHFAIGGTAQGTQYDFLSEGGTAALTLDGKLVLTFANNFQTTVTAGDTFTIFTSNQALAGAFDNISSGMRLSTSDGLGSFQVNYGATSAFSQMSVVLSNGIEVPPPDVTTGAATDVTETTATLNGTVDPKGTETSFYFEYGTDTNYGSVTPTQSAGSGNGAVPATAAIGQLNLGTGYHFRLVATTNVGSFAGNDAVFTTLETPPTVTTGAASTLKLSTATLNGTLNPNGIATDYFFEFGTDTSYGSVTPTQSAGAGGSGVAVGAAIGGLDPNTTYHFRLVAQRGVSTFPGGDATFVTLTPGIFAVAVKGDPAPDVPDAKFFSFSQPAINDAGHFAFLANMAIVAGNSSVTNANNSGIWANAGTDTLELIARKGSPAPDHAGAASSASPVFAKLGDPVFASGDRVAFLAQLKPGTNGVKATDAAGIWSNVGGPLALVARQGSTADGAGTATFSSFLSLGLPDTGGVVFLAKLKGAPPSMDTGIWAADNAGSVNLLLRKGDHLMLNGAMRTIGTLQFLPPVKIDGGQTRSFNRDGTITFRATFTDKSQGVFAMDGTGLREVALNGNDAPGAATGAKFLSFSQPAINDSGHVGFLAALAVVPGGLVTKTGDIGIWTETASPGLQSVALEGTPAAGTPGKFASFSDPVSRTDDAVAFAAKLKPDVAAGVKPATVAGIWINVGGTLALVARQGSGAPDTTEVFTSFTALALPDSGGPVFLAKLKPGKTVNATNATGIWAGEAGAVKLVARAGQPLAPGGPNVRILQFLPPVLGVPGQTRGFNADGFLTFRATFTDHSEGIFKVIR